MSWRCGQPQWEDGIYGSIPGLGLSHVPTPALWPLTPPYGLGPASPGAMGHTCCPYPEPRARKYKCGLPQPCPEEHLAFRMVSGAANVIGPKICLEDKM